jgi:hypothetical protein
MEYIKSRTESNKSFILAAAGYVMLQWPDYLQCRGSKVPISRAPIVGWKIVDGDDPTPVPAFNWGAHSDYAVLALMGSFTARNMSP